MKSIAIAALALLLTACAAGGGPSWQSNPDPAAGGSPYPATWPCNATG